MWLKPILIKEFPAQGGLNREIFTAVKHQNGLVRG